MRANVDVQILKLEGVWAHDSATTLDSANDDRSTTIRSSSYNRNSLGAAVTIATAQSDGGNGV